MLLDDIALVNFALAFGAQEGRVHEDDGANGRAWLTRNYRRGHATHRMAQQNRSHKSEFVNESNDVARKIPVPIAAGWRARIPVASGVGHHDVAFRLESTRQRKPAGSACGQSVEEK